MAMAMAIGDGAARRVAIVGAGPTGLTLAILLRKQGLDPVLFDEGSGVSALPAAHVVNVRTSEILREIGVFEKAAEMAAPFDLMRNISWREDFSGRVFGKLSLYGDEARRRRRLAASPARAAGGRIRWNHRFANVRQRGSVAVLEIAGSGHDANMEEAFDYVLACDGARSTVRRSLGIEMDGPASLAQFMSIYFEAELPGLMRETPGPVHFVSGHGVRGGLISFDLRKTWAFMCVVPTFDAIPKDPGEARTLADRLLSLCWGAEKPDYRIISVGNWNMSAQVARGFRQGPCFLVGDAAHRFPPTGGLGLNTGVQDAHNLAWKLGGVIKGWADPTLLDSYEAERRPIAIANCDQSAENARRMELIAAEIGAPALSALDPQLMAGEATPANSARLPPHSAEQQERIDAAIETERRHFDSLQIELDFQYSAWDGGLTARNSSPKTLGMRTPHSWLKGQEGERCILDLPDSDRFVLVTGRGQSAWAASAKLLADARGIPLATICADDLGGEITDWYAKAGITESGALIVRPDGHVGWGATGELGLPDGAKMEELLRELTGGTL